MNLEDWSSVIATIISVLGGVGAIIAWRRNQLRHSDILTWGFEGINALQSLYLVLSNAATSRAEVHKDAALERIDDLSIQLSVLVEQGRLHFKNYHHADGSLKDWGNHKHTAHRGVRPSILDQLLIGHEVASTWRPASTDMQGKMLVALCAAEREFVSLLQLEVGRSRAVSAEAAAPGHGSPLMQSLANIDDLRRKTGL